MASVAGATGAATGSTTGGSVVATASSTTGSSVAPAPSTTSSSVATTCSVSTSSVATTWSVSTSSVVWLCEDSCSVVWLCEDACSSLEAFTSTRGRLSIRATSSLHSVNTSGSAKVDNSAQTISRSGSPSSAKHSAAHKRVFSSLSSTYQNGPSGSSVCTTNSNRDVSGTSAGPDPGVSACDVESSDATAGATSSSISVPARPPSANSVSSLLNVLRANTPSPTMKATLRR